MPPNEILPLGPTFETLSRMKTQWPGRGWSWDTRFSCVASSINVELATEALAAASLAFPHEWMTTNITTAPPIVRALADTTGGIRPDQVLLTMDPIGSNLVYGLWWPWGDDVTVSFRVGMTGPVVSREEVQTRFRELFGARL
jgi:hypothetical protein